MHGDDDQIVPIGAAALMSAKIVKNATLRCIQVFRTDAHHQLRSDQCDLLAFFKAETLSASA